MSHSSFLLGLALSPEDGGHMILRYVCWLSPDYTALYPRRQNSSKIVKHLLKVWDSQGADYRDYCLQ
jgi:hypothetical protein